MVPHVVPCAARERCSRRLWQAASRLPRRRALRPPLRLPHVAARRAHLWQRHATRHLPRRYGTIICFDVTAPGLEPTHDLRMATKRVVKPIVASADRTCAPHFGQVDYTSAARALTGRGGVGLLLVPTHDWAAEAPTHWRAAVYRAIENRVAV
eukprot:201794-Prymnesium_polylepis.1